MQHFYQTRQVLGHHVIISTRDNEDLRSLAEDLLEEIPALQQEDPVSEESEDEEEGFSSADTAGSDARDESSESTEDPGQNSPHDGDQTTEDAPLPDDEEIATNKVAEAGPEYSPRKRQSQVRYVRLKYVLSANHFLMLHRSH